MPIQKYAVVGTKQFLTEKNGWGLKADGKIGKGSFVCEYVGEVITEKKYGERLASSYKGDKNFYATYIDRGYIIDAHTMGNSARFINHSCSPNCELQKCFINGIPHIGIYTLRDIVENEELTFNYNFEAYGDPTSCQCGSIQCKGFIERIVSFFCVLVHF